MRPAATSPSTPCRRTRRRVDVFDYFGGKDDLIARRVRFIGEPLERIAEDHLRILRFFRFHARFGVGEPDAAGLSACAAAGQRSDGLVPRADCRRIAEASGRRRSNADGCDHAGSWRSAAGASGDRRCRRFPAGRAGRNRTNAQALRERRFAAWPPSFPSDPALAERIAVRLKLSNKARKRLGCAVNSDAAGKRAEPLLITSGSSAR